MATTHVVMLSHEADAVNVREKKIKQDVCVLFVQLFWTSKIPGAPCIRDLLGSPPHRGSKGSYY